jgi:hypothetical protein
MRMDVDFKVFERLALFARGLAVEKRKRRRVRGRWRVEEVEVPVYRRLVMIFKLRPHPRLGKHVDTQSVYFQLFKNIPRLNIAMLLPGARARISLLDRGKISISLLSGLALTVWRFLKEVWHSVQEIFFFQDPIALWILASGAVGYGIKSYFGYQQTKQRYTLTLTQVLYYQNLDTNAGVLYRLLNEGEEQMCREVILGYYSLWRHAGETGWTARELEEAVEKDLERRANLHVGFEVKDAVRQLTRLGLVEQEGERYRAVPLERAVEALEHFWEGCVRTMDAQEVTADARIRR